MPLTDVTQMIGLERLTDLDKPVTCPAGRKTDSVMEGPACVCAITESVLTAAKDPMALVKFCMAEQTDGLRDEGYPACPVWRDAREREWERRRTVLEEPEGRELRAQTIAARDTAAVRALEREEWWAENS
jgi:hypothetical protein